MNVNDLLLVLAFVSSQLSSRNIGLVVGVLQRVWRRIPSGIAESFERLIGENFSRWGPSRVMTRLRALATQESRLLEEKQGRTSDGNASPFFYFVLTEEGRRRAEAAAADLPAAWLDAIRDAMRSEAIYRKELAAERLGRKQTRRTAKE